jgi:hypothetical protein
VVLHHPGTQWSWKPNDIQGPPDALCASRPSVGDGNLLKITMPDGASSRGRVESFRKIGVAKKDGERSMGRAVACLLSLAAADPGPRRQITPPVCKGSSYLATPSTHILRWPASDYVVGDSAAHQHIPSHRRRGDRETN